MNNNQKQGLDERLDALLREWKSPTPSPHFEAAVWRRIRSTPATEPFGDTMLTLIKDWLLPQPAWVPVMALVVAVVLGAWAGSWQAWSGRHDLAHEPLLQARTLAGSYLAMNRGETR
jgi:hypothetical protein